MDAAADQPVVAIDFGGTQIRAALVTPHLDVLHRRAVATRDEEGVTAVVDRICELARSVVDRSRDQLGEPLGVGISAPGPLDPWRGVVLTPPNLAGWRDVPIGELVEQALGLPTFVERDTNVAVMAEWRFGVGRGARNVIYMTISTGLGGGIVLDGRPLYGPDGVAGEIGHLTVELDGPLCGDGMPGHAEAIGSGTAIAREARALLERGGSPRLAELAAEGEEVDAALVARAADDGDAACRAILDRAWTAVGAVCAGLVNVLNPEVIVLGGSIAEHRPRLIDAVRAEVERRSFPVPRARVRIEPARFGSDVSLIGALPIVIERINDPAFRRGRSAARGRPAVQGAAPK